jgi:hypothetical protein
VSIVEFVAGWFNFAKASKSVLNSRALVGRSEKVTWCCGSGPINIGSTSLSELEESRVGGGSGKSAGSG